jgi:signal transduction histidine kinase/ActR/RegA family two-component response regulator
VARAGCTETVVSEPAGTQEALSLWTLEEIGRVVSESGNPEETLLNVVNLIRQRFDTDVCSLYMLDFERANLVLSATIGLQPGSVGKVSMRLDEGLVGLVAETRQPQFVADATTHSRFKYFPDAGEDRYHSFLGVPVIARGLLQGVLVIQTVDPRVFGPQDVRMLAAAATQVAPILFDARQEQRRVVEQALAQRAKAELLETLASGVAHELNNKLMPVAGYAELMLDEARRLGHRELEEGCTTVRDSVFEAAQILRQLLQLSKPATSEFDLCDLRQIAEQTLTLVRLRLQESGTALVTEFDDEALAINADAGQLKQVFVNIVWNAIDAMEASPHRTLTIRLHRTGGSAALAFIDTGSGIPRHALPRIFDPFFTTKPASRGTGLGLSMCQAIVRQHGGEIRVSTTEGVGTAFHVTLPLFDGIPEVDDRIESPRHDIGEWRDCRVLVVDDEERLLQFAVNALRSKLGCDVRAARNGIEATHALQRDGFDLIVSDVRMPHMNGVELMAWLRANRPEHLPRTMFMTGDGSGAGLNGSIRDAGRPLLRKPIAVAELLAGAERILRAHRRQRATSFQG